MELGFREKNKIKNAIGPVSVTHLCLSLPAGFVSVYPQSGFIYMTESMCLDFYILQLQPPKKDSLGPLGPNPKLPGGTHQPRLYQVPIPESMRPGFCKNWVSFTGDI